MKDYRDILAQSLPRVRDDIAGACRRVGRREEDVRIIAVTKGHPVEALRAVRQAGLTDIGENRVSEALEKAPDVGDGLTWHFIGHLQTNKVRDAFPRFRVFHSLDRLTLAEELQKRAASKAEDFAAFKAQAARHGMRIENSNFDASQPVRCFLQVNVSGEASKGGFRPEEAAEAVRRISALDRIELAGLMTMAPIADDPEKSRPVFRALRELCDRLRADIPGASGLVGLSMGMSQDYAVAVEEGATHLRIGTALFGEREG